MPRKTKETDVEKEEKKVTKTTKAKGTSKPTKTSKVDKTTKGSKTKETTKAAKKTAQTKTKATTEKTTKTEKKVPLKKADKSEKKSTTEKKTTKATKKVAAAKKTIKNKEKKVPAKKVAKTTKKATTKAKKSSRVVVSNYSPEYYDLPYRYNQTIVKILAQTPNNLFIYWDIADSDRQNLKEQYGEYFFQITKPVLIVINETMNYSFEVDINDFANSWYLHINDSDCEYKVELGRRPIPINYNYIPEYDVEKNGPIKPVENQYIYISSSNEIVSPNDKILFNLKHKIYFRNVKTNEIIERDIKDFPNIFNNNNMFVDIYKIYKDLYKDEILTNPSSGNPTSGSLSSRFK